MIKISVKIGMLQRGEKFSQEEKEQLVQIQMNLRVVAKTLITFHQLEHTYDRSFLTMYMEELETSLKNLVRPHLTEKSVRRVEQVLRQLSTLKIIDLKVFSFQIFCVLKTAEFLDALHRPNYLEMRLLMDRVVQDLTACLEAGTI